MLWFVSARNIEADGSLGGKKMACRDVPVMEIVKEFREINQRRNGNLAKRGDGLSHHLAKRGVGTAVSTPSH